MSADPAIHSQQSQLQTTPLYDLHKAQGAKLVPFEGYEMPLHYEGGIMQEHLHCRSKAGLFDVSHMGQAALIGSSLDSVIAALEPLIPNSLKSLKPGQLKYSLLLTQDGGISDDLMITRPLEAGGEGETGGSGRLALVVNAGRKVQDYELLRAALPNEVSLETYEERALLALQGPLAGQIMAALSSDAAQLSFMRSCATSLGEFTCHVSRSGYTGEDGFEISVASEHAEGLAKLLLAQEGVALIGLGARDSLRLEAGLCLYGHDLTEDISPIEAGLNWVVSKKRAKAGAFRGAARIVRELEQGPPRLRVGIQPRGRAPAREGVKIESPDGAEIGVITSGGYGPSFEGPVAMGYVDMNWSKTGTEVNLIIRGKAQEAVITDMPFVPHRYSRTV